MTAARFRLGQDLCLEGAPCAHAYVTAGEGHQVGDRCSATLDAAGLHAATCLVGGHRKQTHHTQRDLWAQLLPGAGYAVQCEQHVPRWGPFATAEERKMADPAGRPGPAGRGPPGRAGGLPGYEGHPPVLAFVRRRCGGRKTASRRPRQRRRSTHATRRGQAPRAGLCHSWWRPTGGGGPRHPPSCDGPRGGRVLAPQLSGFSMKKGRRRSSGLGWNGLPWGSGRVV